MISRPNLFFDCRVIFKVPVIGISRDEEIGISIGISSHEFRCYFVKILL